MKVSVSAFLSGLLTALLIAGAAVGSDPEQSQVTEQRSEPQQNVLEETRGAYRNPSVDGGMPPSGVTPATGERQARPDEERLWTLLRTGQLDKLDREIADRRAADPGWQPSKELRQQIDAYRQRHLISFAKGHTLIELSRRYPHRFSCAEIDHLWRLAEAWTETGAPGEARRVYERILGECRNPSLRLATIQKARPVFSDREYLQIVEREQASRPSPELGLIRLELRRTMATSVAEDGNCPQAVTIMQPLEEEARGRRDIHTARLLGWCHMEAGKLQQALPWLKRASDWSGEPTDRLSLARGLDAAGRSAEALEIARPMTDSDPRASDFAYGILVADASEAMSEGDCRRALVRLEEASALRPLSADTETLRGWACYNCGEYQTASEVFAGLYTAHGDDASAHGLVVSDYRQRRLDHSMEVALARGGPLAARLPKDGLPMQQGLVDYDRLTLTEAGSVQVITNREWAALAGPTWSTRQGDGPSRLDAWRLPAAEMEFRRDRHRFELRAARLDLDSGGMGPGDFPVNTDRISGVSITRSESNAWEPVASWSYEGETSWFLEAGSTPTGGEVSPTWRGRFGAAHRRDDAGWSVAAVREPVEESVLSWTGARGSVEIDGSTVVLPFSWGRVTRNGLDLDGYRTLGDHWRVSGGLQAGDYRGHNVDSNLGGQFYGLAERQVGRTAQSNLWLGPYVYLSGFENNRGKFAPGHGGYFSPSWLVGTGLAGRWRAESPNHPWYLEIRGSAGYQTHEEDAADLIPDDALRRRMLDLLQISAADLGRFGSNSESGFAGTLELEGLRRIGGSRWFIGGMMRGRISPEFDNAAATLILRYGSDQPVYTLKRQYREKFSLHD